MSRRSAGRHFLQIPGPTNVPDRVLRAIDNPTVDHRGPEFQAMSKEVLANLKHVFKTRGHVVVFPASGTGAWERCPQGRRGTRDAGGDSVQADSRLLRRGASATH